MNKFKILWMMRKKMYRWRYTYLFFYAFGCRNVPKLLAKRIAKENAAELEHEGLLSINLATYDGGGQAVHPDMLMKDGKMWLVCTPYPYAIESYENPCVYFGDTVYGLKPIKKSPLSFQEFRRKHNHISDPCIFQDNKRLYVMFRDTINIGGEIIQKLYVTASEDGTAWTEKRLVAESNTDSYISSAVLKHGNQYFMFYIQLRESTNGGPIRRVCMNDALNLMSEDEVACHGIPDGMVVWHIGVTYSQDNSKIMSEEQKSTGLTGVFVLRDQTDVQKYTLYWAHTDSLLGEWYLDDEIVIPDYLSANMKNVYKSALIPDTGDILLSYNDKAFRWCLCVIPGKNTQNATGETCLKDSYRVFSRVFRKNMPYERFAYKHLSNPELLRNFYIQKAENEKIIGTNCFDGAEVVCSDVVYRVAQSCDTAVVPEARGKGVFVNLISDAEVKLKAEGVDMMVGFPNNNSYHGFIKLGWKHIGNFVPLVKVIKPIDVLLGKLFKTEKVYAFSANQNVADSLRAVGIEKKEVAEKCLFSEQDFQLINADGVIKVRRTTEYYAWKCDMNDRFTYLVYRGSGKLAYLIVRVNEKGRILVSDYFFSDKDAGFVHQCMEQFVKDLESAGNTIIFAMVHPNSVVENVLRRLYFVDGNHKVFGIPVARMITHPLNNKGETIADDFERWQITPLDVDTIIS